MSEGEGTSAACGKSKTAWEELTTHAGLGVTRQQTARLIRKKSLYGFSLPLLRKQHVVTA